MNRKYRRRKLNVRELPPAAIAAFKVCEEIIAADAHGSWEEDGGRRHEYLAADVAMMRALHLPPWHISPSDPGIEGPQPDYMKKSGLCAVETWDTAKELRRELQKAAKQ